ncbi:MAG: 50S ribosomal protein L11 methyltransferase [Ancalomicrobiaceae bacterium]|nr:50S ribosomal protein L11 methyltransferase [Ancalomicrobiaceae bacterium]
MVHHCCPRQSVNAGPAADAVRRFVLEHARLQPLPHVPEIQLYLADEAVPLWQKTEEELAEHGAPLPYWAFAWAGGQGLARYVLDHADVVKDRRVVVFAAGAGLEAIAAVKAGAASVTASEIDPFARSALALNAEANAVRYDITEADYLTEPLPAVDMLLLGDVFFEQPMSDRVNELAIRAAMAGAVVLVGDPGRSYLPRERLTQLAEYLVPTTRALEDADVKRTVVWRFDV